MIRSFSNVPAFKKQIVDLSTSQSGKQLGYYWRRRGVDCVHVYFSGQIIAETKNTIEALLVVRDHAKRLGFWKQPDLQEHYFAHIDGTWRLYVNQGFAKKSKNKKELEDYVEIMSWLYISGKIGSQWSKK